jgi:AcrR family transcriptional regulator
MKNTTKQRRSSDVSDQIVDRMLVAARAIFLRDGYRGASMSAIARKAGGSKGTLYAHFTGKEDLFAAVVTGECQRHEPMMVKVEGEQVPVDLLLRQFATWFVEFLLRPDVVALHRIVTAEAHEFPELGRILFELGSGKIRSIIAEFLQEAVVRQELNIPDTEIAAELFLSLVRGPFQLRSELGYAPADLTERSRWIDAAVDLFVAGYRRVDPQLRAIPSG